ncbi:phosphotransferase family protein [Acidiferrimicrobium sp. IK]|uniref:phosphotransferase family protein n=1 Tax=Acidiferrimicrobium sp. IK TaxID=2871700 RepID=UPI0021CB6CC0|nr:phosphotransferase family protein [Acidiferrimicrobium sp. IK]MCU4187331.1 phosphotransferase family protein [Acidiferrimicrobium sp. IK]
MTDPDGSGVDRALPGIDTNRVSAWYADNIPGTTLPLHFTLIAGGRSNLTYRVDDAAGRATVLRRPPTGHLLPTAHDMAREHRLIAAVAPAGVPVAPALGLCTDESVNGAPFYVMGFVDGLIVRSAEQAEAAWDVPARRVVAESLIDTLAQIHAVDPDAAGLGDLSRREGYVARQLKRWYSQYQASRDGAGGPDVKLVDQLHGMLSASIPEQGPATLVHGDYRLDNTVVGSDHRIAAVLDWELCTLGDPLADMGALLAYWSEPGEESPLGASATGVEGFPLRAEVAELYAKASGRDLSQLDFFYAFALWKLACILEGVYVRYVAGAMGDTDFDYSFYPAAISGLAERAHDALKGR